MVTGGEYSLQRVTQYSLTGEVTELPDLNTRRRGHACSRFVNTEGVTVSYKHVIRVDFKSIFSIFFFYSKCNFGTTDCFGLQQEKHVKK